MEKTLTRLVRNGNDFFVDGQKVIASPIGDPTIVKLDDMKDFPEAERRVLAKQKEFPEYETANSYYTGRYHSFNNVSLNLVPIQFYRI